MGGRPPIGASRTSVLGSGWGKGISQIWAYSFLTSPYVFECVLLSVLCAFSWSSIYCGTSAGCIRES